MTDVENRPIVGIYGKLNQNELLTGALVFAAENLGYASELHNPKYFTPDQIDNRYCYIFTHEFVPNFSEIRDCYKKIGIPVISVAGSKDEFSARVKGKIKTGLKLYQISSGAAFSELAQKEINLVEDEEKKDENTEEDPLDPIDISDNYSVRNANKKIDTLKTAEQVDRFIFGEKRKTIIKYGEKKIRSLESKNADAANNT